MPGVAGVIGTTPIGAILKQGLYRTLVVIPVLRAAFAAALVLFGDAFAPHNDAAGLWEFFATAEPVGWWTRLSRTLFQAAEAGCGLLVAVVQFAITVGAIIISAVALLASADMALLTAGLHDGRIPDRPEATSQSFMTAALDGNRSSGLIPFIASARRQSILSLRKR